MPPLEKRPLKLFVVNVCMETAKCIAMSVLERFKKRNVKVLRVVSERSYPSASPWATASFAISAASFQLPFRRVQQCLPRAL